jgi:signal transduction histidine kinase/ligand-binding sensor domain-containing protein
MARAVGLAGMLVCLSPALAHAAPTRLLADYTHTAWTGQQGAPSDIVKFAQTTDGWLWMASPNGLYRFDGVRFERMDSVQGQRLHSTSILGLLATPDGSLWVGHRFGGISRFHHGAKRLYTKAGGLPDGAIFSITQGPDGAIWAATTRGLGHLAPGAHDFRTVGPDTGLPLLGVRQIVFTRDGRQWVSVQGGIYWREPGATRYQRAWPYLDLMAMAEAPDGALWASDGSDKQYRVRTAPPASGQAPRAELNGNGMHFDRDGVMWVLKAHALERRAPPYLGAAGPAQQLSGDNGISGPLPQTWFQDREGAIWIGTSAGLDRLRRNRIATLPVAAPFDHPGIVADAGGRVLIGDSGGLLRSFAADGSSRPAGPGRMSTGYAAPDGSVWVANEHARWRRGADGAWARLEHPRHLDGFDTQAMTLDRDGRMWISLSRQGLFRIDQQAWVRDGGLKGLPQEMALALNRDGAGRVWAGFVGNRIARIDGAHVDVFNETDGLQLGTVQSLLVDGARIWAGGEQGVAWFDGARWNTVAAPLRGVSGMVRTAGGELWLHGAEGVTRIAAAQVAAMLASPAHVPVHERFDALDGLMGSAEQLRPLPSLVQAGDGRLWFASASNVASIDPRAIPRNPVAPPVQILAVHADGHAYAPDKALTLPTGARDLQIGYTALGLAMPERVRFRYRLAGVDSGWHEAAGRREAFYTNLAPGDYRFEVTAANEDGLWNPDGAALALTIPPRFVETRTFAALMTLLACALLYGLYVLRLRRVTRRMDDLLHARLAERSRIARGLHDTLLQSVQGLIMFFDQQARRLPRDAEERRKIEQTLELADQLMSEGRDYIMDLRAAGMPQELGAALREYGAVLLHERLAVSINGRPRALVPGVRDELHAIAREALFNAARHAQASKVELMVEYGARHLQILVRDDGCGMATALTLAGSRPGHFGMAGMQERAASIGAACTLQSRLGAGTSVHLTIGAEQAYVGAARTRLLARLRQRLPILKAA